MRTRRQAYLDAVAWPDRAAVHDNRHDAGSTDDIPALVAPDDGLEQAWPEDIDLRAGVAQSGDLDEGVLSELQERVARQPKQVETGGDDVLAHFPGGDVEALLAQLDVQLGVDQVHLAQVRLRRVRGHPAAVLHGGPGVRIACTPSPGSRMISSLTVLLKRCSPSRLTAITTA